MLKVNSMMQISRHVYRNYSIHKMLVKHLVENCMLSGNKLAFFKENWGGSNQKIVMKLI